MSQSDPPQPQTGDEAHSSTHDKSRQSESSDKETRKPKLQGSNDVPNGALNPADHDRDGGPDYGGAKPASDDAASDDAASELAKSTVSDWLETFGDEVYAYAVGRVESREVADDLVQDTFLAAMKSFSQFKRDSSPKTWLIAILRNKIISHYRSRGRRQERELPLGTDGHSPPFDGRGIWASALGKWPQAPDSGFESREFWTTLQDCLQKLPASCAEVFTLRVLDELDSQIVCKTLDITSTNMAVRLHRARLGLRECLERNWFGESR